MVRPQTKEVAEQPQAKFEIPATCEEFRPIVEKHFGNKVDEALFVASKESRRCTVNIADKANSNGTWDYCIFQINNEPKTRLDLDLCVKRAKQKFAGGRIGNNNWSAWYAVCTPEAKPKYNNIKCN